MRSFVIFVLSFDKNRFTTMDTDTNVLGNEQLTLSEKALSHLNTARKWSMFLSIYGFIQCGLIILGGIGMFGMQFLFSFQKEISLPFPIFAIMGIMYLILGVICFFPSLYLYKFSDNAGKLVNYRNQESVNITFQYLGNFYKFMGIIVIITLAIYLISIPLFFIFSLSSYLY